MARFRRRMSRGRSKRLFRRTSRPSRRNRRPTTMRGGFRL